MMMKDDMNKDRKNAGVLRSIIRFLEAFLGICE